MEDLDSSKLNVPRAKRKDKYGGKKWIGINFGP